MLSINKKNANSKQHLWLGFSLVLQIILLIFIANSFNVWSETSQDAFAYTVKVRDTVEQLDKIFERAEVNVNVMVDSISNSYNVNRQQDKKYNLGFVNNLDGLLKSVLSNSPGVNGSWFQLNIELPFPGESYNWYEFKEDQFIDIKNQFVATPSREINPDDDPYYFDAINNRSLIWSDIYKDADTKETMMTISAPVYKNSLLVGVVGIDISIENLQQALKSMQLVLGDSDLYLLDKKKNVILSQISSDPDVSSTSCPFLGLFRGREEGPIEYSDHSTKKTAIKLKLSNDYELIIAINNKALFGKVTPFINIIYILLVLAFILTAIPFLNQFEIKIMKKTAQIKDETEKESEENDNEEDEESPKTKK